MIKEAIILAGGLGTRLQEAVPDLPKCMASVAGHPFLTYVIRHLLSQGIERFIFSLGYKHDVIVDFLKAEYSYLNYVNIIEDKPLGTGGAIRQALAEALDRDVLIVNGDTLFKIEVDDLMDRHMEMQADCSIALKPMKEFDRYGLVETDEDGVIVNFREKRYASKGNINGGVYLLNRVSFLKNNFPPVFSFENHYLESYVNTATFIGVLQDTYFIDIGIPGDYAKAQEELKYPPLDLSRADQSWTLFLDRDGVINFNKDKSYVFHKAEFILIPGALEALKKLRAVFGKIIILTNQRGIGKGLMDEAALRDIHQHMIEEVEQAGGRIDALYYCAINDDKHHDRKPNPGMPLEAAHMYPEIDFSKTIMVGDKMSDMQLGRNIGAYTVLISTDNSNDMKVNPDIDFACASLSEFAILIPPTP